MHTFEFGPKQCIEIGLTIESIIKTIVKATTRRKKKKKKDD